MTGLEGNRQINSPRDFLGGDPESQGANREPIPRGTSHYLFYYTIMLRGHSMKNNEFLIGSLLDLPWF